MNAPPPATVLAMSEAYASGNPHALPAATVLAAIREECALQGVRLSHTTTGANDDYRPRFRLIPLGGGYNAIPGSYATLDAVCDNLRLTGNGRWNYRTELDRVLPSPVRRGESLRDVLARLAPPTPSSVTPLRAAGGAA